MPTHVALLRGINVGGRNKVAMADLRKIVESLGHRDVATYIQSGNVVFTSEDADTAAIAAELERALEETLGLRPSVVVLSQAELAKVIADNPFPRRGESQAPPCRVPGRRGRRRRGSRHRGRRAPSRGQRQPRPGEGRRPHHVPAHSGRARTQRAGRPAGSVPPSETGAAPPATGQP